MVENPLQVQRVNQIMSPGLYYLKASPGHLKVCSGKPPEWPGIIINYLVEQHPKLIEKPDDPSSPIRRTGRLVQEGVGSLRYDVSSCEEALCSLVSFKEATEGALGFSPLQPWDFTLITFARVTRDNQPPNWKGRLSLTNEDPSPLILTTIDAVQKYTEKHNIPILSTSP